MQSLDGACPARDHFEFADKPFEIELANHRVMTLLDQKHAGTGLKLFLDEFEFSLRESKPLHVLLTVCIGVRKQYLCWSLLNDRATDCAAQRIARTLRCRSEHPVHFSPHFQAVLRELFKTGVGEQP